MTSIPIYRELPFLDLWERCAVASHRAGCRHTPPVAPTVAYVAMLDAELEQLVEHMFELGSYGQVDPEVRDALAEMQDQEQDLLLVRGYAAASVGMTHDLMGPVGPWESDWTRCEECGCTTFTHCVCDQEDYPF